jgi:DNA-binding transcriptional LysR family regulator
MNSTRGAVAAPSQLDWNQLRAFLAVADAGSLTGAMRCLATSQPTLSRQIAGLEAALGVALFERVARGLRLTPAGNALLQPARQMQSSAQALSLTALGQTQELGGTVRLTASEMTSAHVLPAILTRLRRSHPEIQLELVASNRVENLLEREADIAVRHTRPTQGGLLAKRVGEARIGAFAHRDYLKRVGGRVDPQRLGDYDWIGLDSSDLVLRAFRAAGMTVDRGFFAFRCDNQIVGWQAALAGMGIGFAPVKVAARWTSMRAVLPKEMMPNMPVWVSAHRELRHSARIRVVFDALAEGLQTMVGV